MKLSPKGQHTLEHMILLILIMAGIIIGGPYAIRSWNAQMKGWEGSVIDSMTDPLMESPPDAVAVTGCDPAPWSSGACGDISSPPDPCRNTITTCSQTQRLFLRSFPSNCQCDVPAFMDPLPVAKCEYDNLCCTDWSPDSDNPDVPAPNPTTDCGVNADPDCPDGEARQTRTCGENPPETRCDPDLACVFNCTGTPAPNTPPQYGALCADDDTELSADTNYTYVDPGAVNCTATKCEIQCSPTFISFGTYCACPVGWSMSGSPAICCPPGQTESAGVCVCAAGWVKACPDGSGGYIAGQCYQGACGANQCEQ